MTDRPITQATVKALIEEFCGQRNMLVIPRVFVSMTGDHIAALLLNQIIYWRSRSASSDSWFYKSHEDWERELGLSPYQIRRALKVLERFGVRTSRRRVRGVPLLHYQIDDLVLHESLMSHLQSVRERGNNNTKVKKLDNRERSRSEYEETSQSENEEPSRSEYEETSSSFLLRETTSKITTGGEPAAAPCTPCLPITEEFLAELQLQYPSKHVADIRQRLEGYCAARGEDPPSRERLASWVKRELGTGAKPESASERDFRTRMQSEILLSRRRTAAEDKTDRIERSHLEFLARHGVKEEIGGGVEKPIPFIASDDLADPEPQSMVLERTSVEVGSQKQLPGRQSETPPNREEIKAIVGSMKATLDSSSLQRSA